VYYADECFVVLYSCYYFVLMMIELVERVDPEKYRVLSVRNSRAGTGMDTEMPRAWTCTSQQQLEQERREQPEEPWFGAVFSLTWEK
jgi:hypothetical protein